MKFYRLLLIIFMLQFFFINFENYSSNNDSEQQSGSIRFWLNNEYINSPIIKFGRSSRITRLNIGFYDTTVTYDSINHVYDYFPQDLEYHEGIFIYLDENIHEFAYKDINPIVDTVKRVYWYPPTPKPRDSLFNNLNKKIREPGKIIVYEMNETDSPKDSN